MSHLEALVLEDALYCGILPTWRQLCVEDNAKRAVADNFALRVREISSFAGEAILDSFTDDFCGATVSKGPTRGRGTSEDANLPPILRLLNAVGRFCDITRHKQAWSRQTATTCHREYGGL